MDLENYPMDTVDKIGRLSDILQKIGQIPFLRKRLSLYGGTALNLLRLPATYRLSIDLDFNYREPPNIDWGKERTRIDSLLKNILTELGYAKNAIKIQPSYPLSRLEIYYHSKKGTHTSLKIETGYLRRIPILIKDELCTYIHPVTGIQTKILTPLKEELFANKFCTMLSRSKIQENARDLFDVWTISKQDFNKEIFMDVVFIESILMELDLNVADKLLTKSPRHEPLRILLKPKVKVAEIFDEARNYVSSIIEEVLESDWQIFINRYKNEKKIPLELFKRPEKINPDINHHPTLKRILQK